MKIYYRTNSNTGILYSVGFCLSLALDHFIPYKLTERTEPTENKWQI